MKLRASNHIITRLVLGHMPAYKEVKDPSLAASPQLKAIQEKIKEAVGISVSAMEAEGPDPFEDEKTECVEKDEKGPKKNEYKDKLLKAPPKVSVQLGSHAVELKTPKSCPWTLPRLQRSVILSWKILMNVLQKETKGAM